MFKKSFIICFIFFFSISLSAPLLAQEEMQNIVSGAVSKIAEDGSYVIVNGQTIKTDADFAQTYMLEEGDAVEISVAEENGQLTAVDCTYLGSNDDETAEEEE